MVKYDKNNKLILSDIVFIRFIRKINIPEYNCNQCWEWNANINYTGYGLYMCDESNTVLVHRIMCELIYGKIPEKFEVDHLCYNMLCVNPDHLEAVPMKENRFRSRIINKGECSFGHKMTKNNQYKVPGEDRIRCCICVGVRSNMI